MCAGEVGTWWWKGREDVELGLRRGGGGGGGGGSGAVVGEEGGRVGKAMGVGD